MSQDKLEGVGSLAGTDCRLVRRVAAAMTMRTLTWLFLLVALSIHINFSIEVTGAARKRGYTTSSITPPSASQHEVISEGVAASCLKDFRQPTRGPNKKFDWTGKPMALSNLYPAHLAPCQDLEMSISLSCAYLPHVAKGV